MIDFAKFIHYSKAGPRYTSYPTAVEFADSFGYENYLSCIEKSNKADQPLSLYVHLPFCRSACYFCGCNVVFTSKDEKKSRYIGYLAKELAISAKYLDTNRSVEQIHFGGGTPTFFSASELEEIINLLKKYFPSISNTAEISCEIDPRFFNEEQMKVLKNGGFNRISFGVQDFNEQVQAAIHRIQSFELTHKAVEFARKYGINSINVDLIYGLPNQTLSSFKETLRLALSLNPERFAVFNYAHVPWLKKTMRKIDETTLPEPAQKLAILKHTMDAMSEAGYKTVGMDHFAKPTDELFLAIEKGTLHRNFQGYTTKGGCNLIGIGLTSISEFESSYVQNYKDLESYEKAIDEGRLPHQRGVGSNSDDILRKAVIMELMSNFKLDIKAVEGRFNINFADYFSDSLKKLKELEEAKLLTISNEKIEVSLTGTLLIRNIAMAFDAYLGGDEANKNRFSKTV